MILHPKHRQRLAVAAALAAMLLPAAAAPADDIEAAARLAATSAVWPADVVRLADDYLRRFGDTPQAAAIAHRREQARAAVEALRRPDVMLFRPAFTEAAVADPEACADAQLAAAGDRAAIRRLAERAAAAHSPRVVGWLQYGVALGDDEAAYALALHYRRQDQPALAQMYESQALAMGYAPPLALDHARK